MRQNFMHLEWDTAFFGFGVARIIQSNLDEAELSNTLKILRDRGYRMVYWFVSAEQKETIRIAKTYGAFLADEKITYVKELVNVFDPLEVPIYTAVPYHGIVPDASLLKLALQSGEYSRFKVDPLFPQNLFYKLYACWITRSVAKEIAWEVLVVKEKNEILGCITLGNKGNRADIGLTVVAKHARHKKVGQALVSDADKCFVKRGYASAQVVTQRHNFGACRLYESCGYQIDKIENVFHFWL